MLAPLPRPARATHGLGHGESLPAPGRGPTIRFVSFSGKTQPFRDLTIEAFVQRLSSDEPVPGGGSASAIAASLGAALVSMVARLSEGRERYAAHAATHARAGDVGRQLSGRFLALADEDAAAFATFGDALRMPRATDNEKASRSEAVRAAARTAADVPLTCVEACLELMSAVDQLAGRSNVNASSDLTVASLMAEAAARGAAANVMVNLPAIGDDAVSARMTARVDELLRDIAAKGLAVRDIVRSGAAREPLPS